MRENGKPIKIDELELLDVVKINSTLVIIYEITEDGIFVVTNPDETKSYNRYTGYFSKNFLALADIVFICKKDGSSTIMPKLKNLKQGQRFTLPKKNSTENAEEREYIKTNLSNWEKDQKYICCVDLKEGDLRWFREEREVNPISLYSHSRLSIINYPSLS